MERSSRSITVKINSVMACFKKTHTFPHTYGTSMQRKAMLNIIREDGREHSNFKSYHHLDSENTVCANDVYACFCFLIQIMSHFTNDVTYEWCHTIPLEPRKLFVLGCNLKCTLSWCMAQECCMHGIKHICNSSKESLSVYLDLHNHLSLCKSE